MTVSTKITDMTGNQNMVDGQTFAFDTILNANIPSASRPVIVAGTGTPNAVLTAAKGSLFLNLTGSSTSTRAFINTDGGTTWTAITTVA